MQEIQEAQNHNTFIIKRLRQNNTIFDALFFKSFFDIPSRRIFLYVIYGSVIIIIIAYDMFVIIALPDGYALRMA